MSEALSAIINVDALRLAEIIRGMIEASTTRRPRSPCTRNWSSTTAHLASAGPIRQVQPGWNVVDRKSTRLNSSHSQISYAVFCLKKKNIQYDRLRCVQ